MQLSQEERTLAGLVHLGVLFGWLGLAFQAVVLAIYQPKSRYTASHAKQALGMWLVWFLVRLALGAITGTMGVAIAFNPFHLLNGAVLGSLLLGLLLRVALFICVLVFMIIGMAAGFGGKPYRYPLIGDLVAQIAGE
jgi:uncharacterized Tic20 family protein